MELEALAETARTGIDSAPDWTGLGLALAMVGCFLVATAILTRSPRDLIEQRFGRRRPPLRSIREPIAGRVQLLLGFAFLMAGFGLQLFARLPGTTAADAVPGRIPAFWIGLVVVCAAALSMVGWWWSNVLVRRHLRAYFREHPQEFETDMPLAREVGELFGVVPHADDTVQTYVARLRRKADLPPVAPPASVARPEPELDEHAPLVANDFLRIAGAPRNRT